MCGVAICIEYEIKLIHLFYIKKWTHLFVSFFFVGGGGSMILLQHVEEGL